MQLEATEAKIERPDYEPVRMWTVMFQARVAILRNVQVMTFTATQFGEVMVHIVRPDGSTAPAVYATEKFDQIKALADACSPDLFPEIMAWRLKFARVPWSYFGLAPAASALRERYTKGRDPGRLLRLESALVEPVEALDDGGICAPFARDEL